VQVQVIAYDQTRVLVVDTPSKLTFSIVAAIAKGSGPLRWELYLHNRLKASGDVSYVVEDVPQREFTLSTQVTHDDFTWATDKDARLSDGAGGSVRTVAFEVLIRGGKKGRQILARGTTEARVRCATGDQDPACLPPP
jgi:hypothetical protein